MNFYILTFNIFVIAFLLLLVYFIYLLLHRHFANIKYDSYYNINTRGLRKWDKKGVYNRTESTPYQALKDFVEAYKINSESQLVDFGSGKGRIMIYLHDKLNIPVTGIEINQLSFEECQSNINSYSDKMDKKNDIKVVNEYAENYPIGEKDNIFFFFNPFNVDIFDKALYNIINNVNKYNKEVDVILYYPIKEYESKLRQAGFQRSQIIKTNKSIGFNEKFIVYKYTIKNKGE